MYEPGSNGNEGVLHIPQNSGQSLGESYDSAEVQLVHSTASSDWTNTGEVTNFIHTHTHTHTHIYIYILCISWAAVVEGDPNVPFSIATTSRWKESATPLHKLLHLPLIRIYIFRSVGLYIYIYIYVCVCVCVCVLW